MEDAKNYLRVLIVLLIVQTTGIVNADEILRTDPSGPDVGVTGNETAMNITNSYESVATGDRHEPLQQFARW